MGFFDKSFYDQLDKTYPVRDYEDDDYDEDEDDDGYLYSLDDKLEINKRNQSEFFDLMESSRVNTDDYWDINDPLIRIILGILFGIGLIGTIYYIGIWFMS